MTCLFHSANKRTVKFLLNNEEDWTSGSAGGPKSQVSNGSGVDHCVQRRGIKNVSAHA